MQHLGQLLYERNCDEKLYPASLTKVLTAIVVIENSDLILYVLNNNDSLTDKEKELLDKIVKKNYIVVVNKSDLS